MFGRHDATTLGLIDSGDSAHARSDVKHAVDSARRASTPLALAYVLTASADTLLDLADAVGEPLLAEARFVVDRLVDPGIAGRYLARTESRHRVAPARSNHAAALIDPLTDREMAVLRYLPTTMLDATSRQNFTCSVNTVKTHWHAIYRKLAVGDRQAAIQAARDLHVL